MITTRDLFNFVNPARTYKNWLKDMCLSDGEMPEEVFYLDGNKKKTIVTSREVELTKAASSLKGLQLRGDKDE